MPFIKEPERTLKVFCLPDMTSYNRRQNYWDDWIKYALMRHLHYYYVLFLTLSLFQCCFVHEWFIAKDIFQKKNRQGWEGGVRGGISGLGVLFLPCSLSSFDIIVVSTGYIVYNCRGTFFLWRSSVPNIFPIFEKQLFSCWKIYLNAVFLS